MFKIVCWRFAFTVFENPKQTSRLWWILGIFNTPKRETKKLFLTLWAISLYVRGKLIDFIQRIRNVPISLESKNINFECRTFHKENVSTSHFLKGHYPIPWNTLYLVAISFDIWHIELTWVRGWMEMLTKIETLISKFVETFCHGALLRMAS